ncbi:MAG: SH3 domain-containing protein [Thermovirgaceae bacterium]|nr:SH3 domain-containing protein [Thermovirgaceae bacterium]
MLFICALLVSIPSSALAVPRNALRFVDGSFDTPLIAASESEVLHAEFKKRFFAPWNRNLPSITPARSLWAWEEWKDATPWGENLRPHSKQWMEGLLVNCSMEEWGSLNRKAAACVETDLRALPTDRPFYRDPSLAGEGFPFDYLQNSRVKAGEPLLVGHLSADKAWAFVETGYAAGWVDTRDIGFAEDALAKRWETLPQAFVIDDGVAVRDLIGLFRFKARIGTVLPLMAGGLSSGYLTVGIPVRDIGGNVVLKEARLPADQASHVPLMLTQWNIATLMNRMLGTPYGWGDSLGNRDCSGTVRDLFAVFGIWLPRNSAAQARAYPFVAFEGGSGEEKEKRLISEAVPFTTLLRVPGHIMVYLGTFRGEPCVFHSIWGIRTVRKGIEGRRVIGAAVITSLRPGEGVEGFDLSRGDLADRLEGMTFITDPR